MKAIKILLLTGLTSLTVGLGAQSKTEIQYSKFGNSDNSNSQRQTSTIDAETMEMSKYWGLTVDEYQRYRQLMKGIAGKMAVAGITPLEVLGMHANTVAERDKYARMTAKMMRDYNQRALDFEYAYQKAYKDMYPNDKIINLDTSKLNLPNNYAAPAQQQSEQNTLKNFGMSLRKP